MVGHVRMSRRRLSSSPQVWFAAAEVTKIDSIEKRLDRPESAFDMSQNGAFRARQIRGAAAQQRFEISSGRVLLIRHSHHRSGQ